MAESVVKLRVDSQEYDAKIKRAGEGVRAFGEYCRKTGESMANADRETLEYVQAIGRMDTVAKNTKGQLRELTQTVTDMTAQYRALTDEEKRSPFGQAMAASIQQLTERAGNASDAMGDVRAAIQHAASDTRVFDQLSAGATFVTSSFQTLQGAAKLVGIEMGDNVEVLAKLQAAMAVTNGLTTIQNALQKQSALMQGVNAVKTALATAAQTAFAAATGSATKAQAAFNAVANMNPYVLLATAVAGVATAMIAFGGSTDEATEAEKRQQEATEKLRRDHEEFANNLNAKVGSSVADTISKFMDLQDQWNRLKTVAEQKAWIDNNKSAFNSLGISVSNVNEAYKIFVEQAPQVIAALRAIAEERALQEVLNEERKKRIRMSYFGDEDRSIENGGKYYKAESGTVVNKEEARAAGIPTSGKYMYVSNKGTAYTAEGAAMLNTYRNRQAWDIHQQRMRQQDAIIAQIEDDHNKKMEESLRRQSELPWFRGTGGLNNYRGSGRSGGGSRGGSTTTTTKKEPPAPVGSLKAYEQELSKLREAQQLVTNNNDWQYYAGQIDVVTKKMKEIRGETEKVAKVEMATGDAGATGNAMGAWISGLQEKLSNTVIGSEQSYKLNEQLLDAQLLQNTLNYALANDITISPDSVESIWEQIIGEENVPDSVWEVLQATINDILAEKGLDPIKLNTKTGGVDNQPKEEKKEEKVLGDYLGEMAGGISSITGGLEDLGIKVPDGISKVVKYLQATQAILTGISTVVTVIMAIQSAKSVPVIGFMLAGGGVVRGAGGLVGGRSFSGDNVPALLNSGEVVLNRAEAGVIANALNNGGIGNLNLSAEVSAEKLRFVLNNNGRRTGRGEIAYSH